MRAIFVAKVVYILNLKVLYLLISIAIIYAIYSYIETKEYSAAKNEQIFVIPGEETVTNAAKQPEGKEKEESFIDEQASVQVFDIGQETEDNKSDQNSKDTKKIPIKLEFPNKNIAAPIKPVGLTKKGDMAVVEDATTIGWYEGGPSPNGKGNALLNGHRDWKGELGTLWKLENYEPGELMVIYFDDGSEQLLALDSIEVYPINFVPDSYMELGGEDRTTVISCAGVFKNGGYQERVIAIFKKI